VFEKIKALFNPERYLSDQALEVYRSINNKDDWELRTFWMNNLKENISLKVGFGFFQFDINDGDYVEEFTLLDKLILWPMVKKLRVELKKKNRLEQIPG